MRGERFTLIGLVVVIVGFATLLVVTWNGDRRPELVVLVTVDTLRPDHLSAYDYARNTSPQLDRLRADAVLYSNCFAAASSTAPSIASIFTSKYPSRHGVTEFFATTLDDEELTLAEWISGAGYRSAAFIGNPVLAKKRNLGQGFAVYDEEMTQLELNRKVRERPAAPLTDAALRWLRSTSGRRFLWLHYQDPHGPYHPPQVWRQQFERGDTAEERRTLRTLKNHSGYEGIPAYQKLPGQDAVGDYVARYDSEISYLDSQLGRLIDRLKEWGLYDRSLIVVTADHGEAFGEDGYYFAHGHSSTPDQTRVPLIVKLPGGDGKGSRILAPVSTLDILPSLLSVVGVASSDAVEGSVLPGLPESIAADRMFFTETMWQYAVVSNRHYYARDKPHLRSGQTNSVTGGVIEPAGGRLFEFDDDRLLEVDAGEAPSGEIARLDSVLSSFYRPGTAEPETKLPESTRKALESLGYLK